MTEDLSPADRARRQALRDRVEQLAGVPGELAVAGVAVGEDDRLEAAARLLRSAAHSVVVYGPSGSGKSTVLNAILDREVLPVGDGVATTSVPVAVVPVTAGEPERCEVRYLDRAAYARRLAGLAEGLLGLPRIGDPFDGAHRARVDDTARRRVLRRAGATDAGLDRLVALRARVVGDGRPAPARVS